MALGGSIWSVLGIEPTNDEREVRRAYARRLKQVHPEDDPDGFKALREAYERALDMARRGWAVPPARKPRRKKGEAVTQTPASDDGGADDDSRRWTEAGEGALGGWGDETTDRWDAAPPAPAPEPELSPEVAAELEAETKRHKAHAALCDELEDLLRQTSVPTGDALGVMMRILRSPAMDSLRVHANTEYWLAAAIARGGPAADSLIEPAVRFFGWDDARIGLDLSHAAPVLRRRDMARVIQQLARPLTAGHDAWKALRAKQTLFRRIGDRLDPSLSRQVEDLLTRAAQDLPDLHGHLDPDAVETWRARLGRPRFSAIFLLSLLILPPILSLYAVAAGVFGHSTLPNFLAGWIVVLAVMTGVGAAWVEGVLKPARKWQDGHPWDAALWKRLGWAPAAAVLLAITPAVTVIDWIWPVVLLAGAGIVGWARIVTSHISAPPPSRYRVAEFVGVIPIALYAIFAPGSGSQPSLLAALLCAILAFRLGGHAIVREWMYADAVHQRRASLALIGGAVIVSALAVAAAQFGVPGLTIGLVCGFAFMDRALATNRFGVVFKMRRGWFVVGWFVAIALSGMAGPIDKNTPIAFALWLVIAGAFTGVAAFLPEPGQKKRRRAGQLA